MNHKTQIVVLLMAAAGIVQGQETFNPRNLPSGSIVRIAAKKPAINLRRAEVLACTTNLLTLLHNHDKFTVAPTNILELKVLEKGKGVATSGPSGQGGTDRETGSGDSAKKGLWDRIKSFWH